MKKSGIKLLIFTVILALFANLLAPSGTALAKKGKSKGLSEEELTQVTTNVTSLMKRVYSAGLFSPKDNENLIDAKLKLDTAMETKPDPSFAQLYYKLGYIYNQREYRDDSIECYQTILDNFSDSPFAAKAIKELQKMGVKIEAPKEE